MIRALIIEDERYIREGLKSHLKNISKNVQIIGECESVQSALKYCENEIPDLVFLDINLKDGTGFDFLNKLNDSSLKVIFITAYEEYVLKALKIGAVDYILKPVDEVELSEAVHKVMSITYAQTRERVEVVKKQFEGNNERVVLKMQEAYQIVHFSDLMYCEADGGYTKFYLKDQRVFIVSKPLKDYSGQLPENIFIRVHQSYLVNISFIDSYDKSRHLFLKNGGKIPVSVRRKESVISRLFGHF